MTLRGRFVAFVVAVTFVSLGGAFATVAAVVGRAELAQLDASVLAGARAEAIAVTREGALPEPPPTQTLGYRWVALYGPDGAVLAQSRSFASPPPPLPLLGAERADAFEIAISGDVARAALVSVPAIDGAKLLFAAPRREVDAEAAFLRHAMGTAFLVAVAWAGLIAFWVVRRMTRGNEAIAAVVRAVAAGDLTARVGPRREDLETARLAADVDEMVSRLQVLVDSQRRFVAHAAHELRSPLTTLYGELQLALRRSRDAEAYRAAIAEALDSTERLRSLSEELLALARAGADDGSDHVDVPLDGVARAATLAVRAEAEARRVHVRVEIEGDVLVRGRRTDLERMLRNLVENAVRHSPLEGTVCVSGRATVGSAEITVEDEGAGIPHEAKERIFEPFFRLARDRGTPGAGLGLAIAREIARAHGGDLTLAAEVPAAKFVVAIPLAVPPSAAPVGDLSQAGAA